ncbi:MAG: hypothetical protein AB1942_10355 [Pseudomonadota bacterium]
MGCITQALATARARHWTIGLAAGLVAALSLGAAAHAATTTLLSVSGTGTTGQFIAADSAAAVSFSLDKAYANVSISADLVCVGCTGEIMLLKGQIGPGASLTNFITGLAFDVSTPTSPVLSGLNLEAGAYFLMLAITGGGGGWIGSDPATISAQSGVARGIDLFASDAASPTYQSSFNAITSNSALHYSITADASGAAPVPQPATWVLLVGGLALTGSALRRRPASANGRLTARSR